MMNIPIPKLLAASLVPSMLAIQGISGQGSIHGNGQIGARANNEPGWADHLRDATVSLGVVGSDKDALTFRTIGTGLLVVKKSGTHIYVAIATAKHVLDDPSQGWHPSSLQVRFASEETKAFSEDTGYTLRLSGPFRRKLWLSLPDDSDVALIPLRDDFSEQLKNRGPLAITDAIRIEDFAEDQQIYDGASIVLFGFPGDVSALMGPNALVRAVTRSGVVAWTNPLSPGDAFMIDANILPGNSGGPVFKPPTGVGKTGSFEFTGVALFYGLVTATISNTDVETVGGLGRVEPASKVKKLVDQAFPGF